MEEQDRIRTEREARHQPPEALADLAFCDIKDLVAAARICETSVRADIKAGLLSEGIRFSPRCTRWPVADVRAWLLRRAERGVAHVNAASVTGGRATKASAAAQVKRRAAAGAAA